MHQSIPSKYCCLIKNVEFDNNANNLNYLAVLPSNFEEIFLLNVQVINLKINFKDKKKGEAAIQLSNTADHFRSLRDSFPAKSFI